jgi:hypothetical protein
MTGPVKFLIGLAAALLMGWLWHGPGGQGEKLIGRLDAQVKEAVAVSRLPGASVRLERAPLARKAVLSGAANDLQREGLGSQWGAKDYARAVTGIGTVRWDDEPDSFQLPLLAETLILVTLFYLAGFGLGVLFFGRRRRTSFLD